MKYPRRGRRCWSAAEPAAAVHQRRRLRHGQPGGCTRAGVAAVNQAGGNKEGVAEHVMAMLLSLSKR